MWFDPPSSGPVDLSDDELDDAMELQLIQRQMIGELAKELIWSDEDWDLLRRYHAHDLQPGGPLEKEDLPLMGTYKNFNDDEEVRRMKIGAEWEPTLPSNDTIIRRYLSFDKFISLLSNGGFWFSNVNKFPDTFEATFPEPSKNHTQMLVDFEKEGAGGHVTHNVKQRRERDQHTYINCWRVGDDESAIFWDSYVGNDNGMAIQTTVGKMCNHLEVDIWDGYIEKLINHGSGAAISEYQKLLAGLVEYLDYEDEPISNSTLSPSRYFHKRHGFNDEKEFRLVRTIPPLTDTSGLPDSEPGIVIGGNLEAIIDKIIFPPGADGVYQNIVESIAEEKLNADVERSALETKPAEIDL